MVSKGYFRSALAHEELKEYLREESEDMEYLMEAGRHAFLKSKQVDITQLLSASARDDRKQVQLLLGMGADVNMRDSVSYTPTHTQDIHILVYCRHTEIINNTKDLIEQRYKAVVYSIVMRFSLRLPLPLTRR